MILLIIYLLGCIVSFILDYRYTLNTYEEIKINDLGFFLIISSGSWASVIIGLFIYYGDKIIVCKKSEKINTKWTITDKKRVEDIKSALFQIEIEHGVLFDEEKEWLDNLKYRK